MKTKIKIHMLLMKWHLSMTLQKVQEEILNVKGASSTQCTHKICVLGEMRSMHIYGLLEKQTT